VRVYLASVRLLILLLLDGRLRHGRFIPPIPLWLHFDQTKMIVNNFGLRSDTERVCPPLAASRKKRQTTKDYMPRICAAKAVLRCMC
jgi:hypothetical protein